MADVAMGNLRFDLTADNSSFMAAVKQAKDAQTQAAAEMGSKFAEAAQSTQRSLQQMAESAGAKVLELTLKLQQLGKAAADVWSKGAEGAEKATTDGFNKLFTFLEGGAAALLAKIPGIWGKVAAGLLLVVQGSGAWDYGWEAVKKKTASALDGMFSKESTDKATQGIRDSLVSTAMITSSLMGNLFDQGTLDEQQKRVTTWADGIQKKLNEMAEAVRTALQKIAGTFDGVSDAVKKAIEGLKERTGAEEFQTGLLGKDRGERTEAMERKRLLQEIGKEYDELNEKEKKLLETELQRRTDAANDFETRTKELEQIRQREQAITSLTSALKRQGDMALANAGRGEGKSAFDRAMERSAAMADGYSRGKVGNLAQDPKILADRIADAQKYQEAANTGYRIDQARMQREAGDKGANDIASLGATAGAIEKARVELELKNKAAREGVQLDAGMVAMNSAIADSMGRIAQATAEARERFEAFREVGRTVASSLEDAFSRMMQGTGFQWKEFIAGLQADLAKLAFKRGVESLLTGTAAGGGGIFGALAGIISGARADGGPVGSGNAYIVGERGPELFVPQGAGSIVPNHGLNSGSPAHVTYTVNIEGAMGREDIAALARAHADVAFRRAVSTVNDGFPARQRQMNLLGN